ncbi:MAG: hypothetical protein BWY70_01721 [Bacteroidetes bacterium ADurb.Bin408]|nr:MAG: hypothetical protein BWY70_01721 [Bacteroidetes bacterium ADurb.Bin408]
MARYLNDQGFFELHYLIEVVEGFVGFGLQCGFTCVEKDILEHISFGQFKLYAYVGHNLPRTGRYFEVRIFLVGSVFAVHNLIGVALGYCKGKLTLSIGYSLVVHTCFLRYKKYDIPFAGLLVKIGHLYIQQSFIIARCDGL